MTAYIPHEPTAKQQAFLLLDGLEALYGGAAGGGKTDAVLMGALQYVDVPGYNALILRRTFADLALPGAVMDRAGEWLRPTAAEWSERDKTWTFPSSARLTFGYLASDSNKYRYQGANFHYIAFDELTQFLQSMYTYLFSRLRGPVDFPVPLRMRSSSNPGGIGHAWVYERFQPDLTPEAISHRRLTGRMFIPATLKDNPHIDADEYRRSLAELDDVERRQLEEGVWITDTRTRPFDMSWWGANRSSLAAGSTNRYLQSSIVPRLIVGRYSSWDTATKQGEANSYTANVVGEITADYRLIIRDVWRDRLQVPHLADKVRDRAAAGDRDGKLQAVIIEDQSSGTGVLQTIGLTGGSLASKLVAFRPSGDKFQRAGQAALWAKRGCIMLPYPDESVPWLHQFEKDLGQFPDVEFDDTVDAFNQLVIYLEHILATGWRKRNGIQ